MSDSRHSSPARVIREDGRMLIEVAPRDADELQVHLRSHNIETLPVPGAPVDAAWLEVSGDRAEDVEAVLGQWEVG